MTEQSLYERLGGVDAIAMVVDRFSDKIVENPKLNVNPQLREWNGKGLLPGLKFMRTLWLCAVAGGPFHYTGRSCTRPTRISASPLKSSTRWERRSPAPSTTSM
jgi:hemoglobin